MEPHAEERLGPCADCGHSCSVEAISCPNCGKPFSRAPESGRVQLDDKIFDRILTHSSMKIGMCLTLLGLIRVVEGVRKVSSLGDELLAINAIGFLASSILSYFAVKETDEVRKRKKGRASDILFSSSLCLLAIICGIIAFQLV